MAECYEQMTLVSFGNTKDPAMVKTVERPSASEISGSPRKEQRKETRSQGRNNVPMSQGKDHVTLDGSGHMKAGDGSRDNGGTQEFLCGSITTERNRSS
ncbi:MAG: hypothetical protein ACXAEN_21640 [Candidatus Thorarchaeota archaeon]